MGLSTQYNLLKQVTEVENVRNILEASISYDNGFFPHKKLDNPSVRRKSNDFHFAKK